MQSASSVRLAAASRSALEARQQAEAEGLILLRSEGCASKFLGVTVNSRSRTRPYQARVKRAGKNVSLGCFASAEEAALAYARSPEGREAAAAAAAEPAPMTALEALRQAEAEGLMLLLCDTNVTGFQGVFISDRHKAKPCHARVWRGGKYVHLGCFATAEEAALAFARSPEGRAAAADAAAASTAPVPLLLAAEAWRQAEKEGLTLLRSEGCASGFLGVFIDSRGKTRPYEAKVWRDGKYYVHLGRFATAEEAALAHARSPEGRAAAAAAAAARRPAPGREPAAAAASPHAKRARPLAPPCARPAGAAPTCDSHRP